MGLREFPWEILQMYKKAIVFQISYGSMQVCIQSLRMKNSLTYPLGHFWNRNIPVGTPKYISK